MVVGKPNENGIKFPTIKKKEKQLLQELKRRFP